VGCRKQLGKAEFLLQVLAASELSHETVQAEGGPEKLLVLHRTAALSRADSSKKLSHVRLAQGSFHPSGPFPWLQVTGKSINIPLFQQHGTSRFSKLNRACSKQHDFAKRNLLPRTDSVLLLLSYNIIKIWLILT